MHETQNCEPLPQHKMYNLPREYSSENNYEMQHWHVNCFVYAFRYQHYASEHREQITWASRDVTRYTHYSFKWWINGRVRAKYWIVIRFLRSSNVLVVMVLWLFYLSNTLAEILKLLTDTWFDIICQIFL